MFTVGASSGKFMPLPMPYLSRQSHATRRLHPAYLPCLPEAPLPSLRWPGAEHRR
ncbi:uncharacterized protein B0H18DRAFT_980803 [Fomitopsis serialis]|uniref:uncharacterized protein n=1 Tax=Fomitopsis serialis TaxID=139415 RepID=UPI00200785BD|nr:uncharacterized protein B0H18DRAFT_980803 [Neoantrodia serialis]KAH9934305.1 hypothetical protein B0H18DRAFT_980803 [Neoantrodia serialis]